MPEFMDKKAWGKFQLPAMKSLTDFVGAGRRLVVGKEREKLINGHPHRPIKKNKKNKK